MADLTQARSQTDPPAPEDHRTQRSHLPRRLHAHSFRSKGQWGSGHHLLGQSVKSSVQSAVELKPAINFEHLRRKEHKSATNARGAATPLQAWSEGPSAPATAAAEAPTRTADVAKAKRHNVKREETLRADLKKVEEIGRDSTRQLDETYYGILEKASLLRSTVAGLQLLAQESKEMHTAFNDSVGKLESDTAQTIQGFDNFDPQEKTINDLVRSIEQSKSTTEALNSRLESARLRVEAYEKRDNAKQAKRKIRLRMTWITILGLTVLAIAILIARDRKRVGHVVERQLLRIGDLVDDVAAPIRLKPSPSEDPRLQRLFDEI